VKRIALVAGLAIVASCGTKAPSPEDAGSDVMTDALSIPSCASDSDCPNGERCAYPDKGGCKAHKQCFVPTTVACKGGDYCACDDLTMFDDCGGGASKPVAHLGPCAYCDSSPISCELCDIVGFSTFRVASPLSATQSCSSSEIAAYVAACVGASATPSTCAAWKDSDAGTCAACINTKDVAPLSGAFICDVNNRCQPNHGGCIDIVANEVSLEIVNGGSGSCGDFVSSLDQCFAYACGACLNNYDDCTKDARQAECTPYVYAAANAPRCQSIDAGTSVCSPQSDSDYAAFINIFCGTGP